jgi:phosphopantetheine adenylyltransferase
MVNDERVKNNLLPIELIFVDMIMVNETEGEEKGRFSNKTSSTYIREYLSNQQSKDHI